MVQLLRAATSESRHPRDKFVFVSETTLPVKPFNFIYASLMKAPTSDICIEPRSEWVWLTSRTNSHTSAAVVKHSQWVVLNKVHAYKMIERWPHMAHGHGGSWSVPVWPAAAKAGYGSKDFGHVPEHKLCTDEWAIFASLYGIIMTESSSSSVPGLSPGNLNLNGPLQDAGQGTCRTWVTWGEAATTMRESAQVARKLSYLLSCFPSCLTSHPAHFTSMTDYGLKVLRKSSFLFARKFPANVVTEDQFVRVILSSGPPKPPWSSWD
jgi:hypothetical protein